MDEIAWLLENKSGHKQFFVDLVPKGLMAVMGQGKAGDRQ